jgi:hypothetical protein
LLWRVSADNDCRATTCLKAMHELPRPANARAAGFLATRPRWVAVQRRVMGTILAGLALRLALDARR